MSELPDKPAKPGSSDPPEKSKWFPRRRYPYATTWVLVGICLGSILVLRSGVAGLEHRHDVMNIVSLILGFSAAMTLLVWFVAFSAYSKLARLGTAAAVILAVVLTAVMCRIDHVSGDLIPVLAFRWRADPDEVLEKLTAAGGVVDLATTTEHDFPQFLGPQRNLTVPGVTLNRNWVNNPPKLAWRSSIGAGWSGFAVVNGFAVTMEQRGEEELVTCYEASTGGLQWYHAVRTRHRTILGGVGPRSTPTIDSGKVYALGATGVLRCLDGATGKEIWSDDLLARIGVTPREDLKAVAWGRSASPLVVDGLVIVPLGGPLTGPWTSLAAFDRDTGELAWTGGEHQVSYASPCLANIDGVEQVLIVNQDYLSSHDPRTGDALWQYPWPGKSNANASVSQAVPLPHDRVFLSKGYGGGATLLKVTDEDDGQWRVTEEWASKRVLNTKFTNVVVRDAHVYGLSDGILQCADLETGKRLWKGGRYGQGQILGVEDLLLVQAESGDVVLVELASTSHNELGELPAMEGKTWNNLCLYGRYLLVRNSEMAACYELQ